MKPFIYVRAAVDTFRVNEGPAAIRFEHIAVSAIDEDAAYLQGQRLIAQLAPPLAGWEIANDYIVEPTELE